MNEKIEILLFRLEDVSWGREITQHNRSYVSNYLQIRVAESSKKYGGFQAKEGFFDFTKDCRADGERFKKSELILFSGRLQQPLLFEAVFYDCFRLKDFDQMIGRLMLEAIERSSKKVFAALPEIVAAELKKKFSTVLKKAASAEQLIKIAAVKDFVLTAGELKKEEQTLVSVPLYAVTDLKERELIQDTQNMRQSIVEKEWLRSGQLNGRVVLKISRV